MVSAKLILTKPCMRIIFFAVDPFVKQQSLLCIICNSNSIHVLINNHIAAFAYELISAANIKQLHCIKAHDNNVFCADAREREVSCINFVCFHSNECANATWHSFVEANAKSCNSAFIAFAIELSLNFCILFDKLVMPHLI